MSEISLINKLFYEHDVAIYVATKHPKTGVQLALKTPRYIRYILVPYAAGVRFADVFAVKRELESALSRARRQPVQVRFDDVEFALEVPRTDPVTLDYGLTTQQNFTARMGRSYAFGKASENYLDLADSNSAHTLIAGITGSGKSEMLRTIVSDLLDNNSPADLQVLAIDLKNEGLLPFAHDPHVVAYANEPEQATAIIKWLHGELEQRSKGNYATPRIVLAIDELAELAAGCGKAAVHEELASIGRMGRSRGINIIAAAQKPDAGLIGGQLKSQFGVKIIGQLDSAQTAAFITGRRRSGAESLPGKGSMLLIRDGAQPLRVQGFFVGDKVTEVAATVATKHEALRLKPITLPESDEVATLARKAKPVMEQYARDGKLQRGGVGAVVAELFGQDARNEGHNNRMAQRVISHFFETKGTAHAN